MSMPMHAVSRQLSVQAKLLTGIGNQIACDNPARMTEATQVFGDRDQRGPYN